MKIQFRTLPVPKHLIGWKRIFCCAKNALRGTLVVDFGQPNPGVAN